jgi:RimJ/RimL family protein N-acetyltransferase
MSMTFIQDTKTSDLVELRDGTVVSMRCIHPDDAPRLRVFYAQLSPSSAFFRFLASWKELTLERAEYLTHVDYRTRMAFVATLERAGQEFMIGFTSYACIGSYKNGIAEAAVVVLDQYQGLGLGTALLEHLAAHARTRKIHTFVGTVHVENKPMLRWLEYSGLQVETDDWGDGASDIRVKVELP